MKRHKRDRVERAYTRGYRMGSCGRGQDRCPHLDVTCQRQAWINGWRAGWCDHLEGYTGVPGIQRTVNMHVHECVLW